MKKSTFALSLLLAAGAWAGLAWADEATVDPAEGGDTPAAEVNITEFNFSENTYSDEKYESGNSTHYMDDGMVLTNDVATITIARNGGNGARFWTASPNEIRAYSSSLFTIAVPNGKIEKIEITGKSLNNIWFAVEGSDPATYTVAPTLGTGNRSATYTPTTPAESFTFKCNATTYLWTMKITYTGGKVDEREDAEMFFYNSTQVTNVDPSYFYPSSLSKNYLIADNEVEYINSNPEVGTWAIDEWGYPEFTPLSAGQATITAKFAGNEQVKPGEARLTIKVFPKVPVDALFSSNMGEKGEFSLNDTWTTDFQYFCLKATNYRQYPVLDENGVPKTDENGKPVMTAAEARPGTALTEAWQTIDLKGRTNCKLTAKMAYNYFGYLTPAQVAANYCQVVVREIAEEEEEGGNQGGISPLADGDETEEPAEEWTVVAYEPATVSGFTWNDVTVDLSAYDGKKINIGFRYISTAATETEVGICGTWEINTIEVNGTDPLAPVKEAMIPEINAYLEACGEDAAYMSSYYLRMLTNATSVADANDVLDNVKSYVAGAILNNATAVHVWAVGEKYAASVPTKTEGVSPWNLIDEVALTGAWVAERASDGGAFAGYGGYVVDNSFYLKNVSTNLYVGKATAGEIIGSAASKEDAGCYEVVCTEGKVVIAAKDDHSNIINWDATKGMVCGSELVGYSVTPDIFPTWDWETKINFTAPGLRYNQYGYPDGVDEVNQIVFYVPVGAKLTEMGNITLKAYDETVGNVVLEQYSWEVLKDQDPEPATYTIPQYQYGEDGGKLVDIEYEGLPYVITTKRTYTESGYYYIYVDELMFYLEGEDGEKTYNKESSFSLEIKGQGGDKPGTEGGAIAITPADESTVESISEITIAPTGDNLFLVCNERCEDRLIIYDMGDGSSYVPVAGCQWLATEFDQFLAEKADFWSDPDVYVIPVDIKAAGMYTIYIPEGFFWLDNEGSVPCPETYATIYVTGNGEDGINAISVSREGKIYDLQGRQLSAPAKGINIINGKKVRI